MCNFLGLLSRISKEDSEVAEWILEKGLRMQREYLTLCGFLCDAILFEHTPFPSERLYALSLKVDMAGAVLPRVFLTKEEHSDLVGYIDLVKKVSRIDKEAAAFMLSRECIMADSFELDWGLDGCFTWSKSRQGDGYWRSIWEKL